MTVKELINQLSKINPEAQIILGVETVALGTITGYGQGELVGVELTQPQDEPADFVILTGQVDVEED